MLGQLVIMAAAEEEEEEEDFNGMRGMGFSLILIW